MGRPGLTGHRKFRRLARAVGGAVIARGSLELLWDTCYEAGDDYLGDAADLEAAAQWEGEPGFLARALLDAGGEGEAGFIEEVEGRPGHFFCHDLYDHAPEYVRKRFDREAERKALGLTLNEIRSAKGKMGAAARWGKTPSGQTAANIGEQAEASECQAVADGCQTDGKRMPPGTTPSPTPTPTPSTGAKAPVTEPPKGKPPRKPAGKGPNAHLPEDLQADFWRGAASFPATKKTNLTEAARVWAGFVQAGDTTGPELAGCCQRYAASFSAYRRCYMTQFHAWLIGSGFTAYLEAERRGDPVTETREDSGRPPSPKDGMNRDTGLEDYEMPTLQSRSPVSRPA